MNDKGQSTLEFLLGFAIVFSFLFFFLKIAINYTNGYLLHYANYMASRTYLVYDNNNNDVNGADTPALAAATEVFKTFSVDSFFLSNDKAVITANDPGFQGKKVYVGLVAKKEDSFNFKSFLGNVGNIKFVTESFLGREPIRSECLAQICEAMKEIGGDCSKNSTYFDNGC